MLVEHKLTRSSPAHTFTMKILLPVVIVRCATGALLDKDAQAREEAGRLADGERHGLPQSVMRHAFHLIGNAQQSHDSSWPSIMEAYSTSS